MASRGAGWEGGMIRSRTSVSGLPGSSGEMGFSLLPHPGSIPGYQPMPPVAAKGRPMTQNTASVIAQWESGTAATYDRPARVKYRNERVLPAVREILDGCVAAEVERIDPETLDQVAQCVALLRSDDSSELLPRDLENSIWSLVSGGERPSSNRERLLWRGQVVEVLRVLGFDSVPMSDLEKSVVRSALAGMSSTDDATSASNSYSVRHSGNQEDSGLDFASARLLASRLASANRSRSFLVRMERGEIVETWTHHPDGSIDHEEK
jgi:hypothetical protein